MQGSPSTGTFNAVDRIDGGKGIDTLYLNVSGASPKLEAADVTNVEIISVRNTGSSAALAVDGSMFVGATEFVNDRSTNAAHTVFNNIGAADVTIQGNGTTELTGTTIGAGVTTTDPFVLNIKGGVKGNGNIVASDASNDWTDVTINSTGAANKVGTVAFQASTVASLTINAETNLETGAISGFAGTNTITIKGAADSVNIATLDAAVDVVNASGLKGGLTAELGAVTQQITGGAGDDTISTGAIVLTTGFVNAGGGEHNRLIVDNAAALTAVTGPKYTGFEILRNASTATDLDVSSLSTVGLLETSNAAAGFAKMTAAQAANVKILLTNTSGTFSLKDATGAHDVLGLRLENDSPATTTAINATTLTVNGFETLNVVASSGVKNGSAATAMTGADSVSFASSGATDLTTVNVTGAYDLDLSGTNITKAVTVNASNEGAFAASGQFKAGSVINGNNVKNFFTVEAGADTGATYNGGAGNDVFTSTVALLVADGNKDNILNAGAGTADTLNISDTDAPTLIDSHFTHVRGFEELYLAGTGVTSVTTGRAFDAAFKDGVKVTSATLSNDKAYTFEAGLSTVDIDLALTSSGTGDAAADNINIKTGAGNDIVAVTAKSWEGAAGSGGALLVTTGAGDDIITVTTKALAANTDHAAVQITGGLGKDIINLTGANAATGKTVTITVGAGDSTTTVYDSITGFDLAAASLLSSTLDFAGTMAIGKFAVTDSGIAGLSIAANNVGLITFSGTNAATATLEQKIAAVQTVVDGGPSHTNDAVVFTHADSSYVFSNNTAGDSLVELVGVTAAGVMTANAHTTADLIFIE